jgi:hypothetical protein
MSSKAAAFLQAMETPAPAPVSQVEAATITPPPVAKKRAARSASSVSRTGLKHIGGYFDRDDVEKIALLRARLALDNSELIRLAVDELYKREKAKRAFGDA